MKGQVHLLISLHNYHKHVKSSYSQVLTSATILLKLMKGLALQKVKKYWQIIPLELTHFLFPVG